MTAEEDWSNRLKESAHIASSGNCFQHQALIMRSQPMHDRYNVANLAIRISLGSFIPATNGNARLILPRCLMLALSHALDDGGRDMAIA